MEKKNKMPGWAMAIVIIAFVVNVLWLILMFALIISDADSSDSSYDFGSDAITTDYYNRYNSIID